MLLFTTKCHVLGEVTCSPLEGGMQWIYFQDAVIEKRGILLTNGRKNKKNVAAVEKGHPGIGVRDVLFGGK